MPTSTYVALATQTLGTAVSSVTFSSIPQGYTDLVLVSQLTGSAANNQINIQVGNGSVDTGSNYSFTQMYGTGSATASARSTSQTSILLGYTDAATTSINSNLIASIQNYSNTTTNKTILSRGNSPARATAAIVGLWRSTSAINIITVSTGSSTFAVGSTFTIYGIAATSAGAKATGGTIFSDSQYYYHAFLGNGTFTPTQSISADVLVVAGGGGGGGSYAGGGGAGGVLAFTGQSLTATNYTCTVGAGGTGGAQGVIGNVGVDSQFGALTLVKGGGAGGHGVATSANTGGNGGSGGGAGRGAFTTGNVAGGTATSGQGNNGGAYIEATAGNVGAGGGGAGAIGGSQTVAGTIAGVGGAGVNTYSSWLTATGLGVSGFIAGGGGGGAFSGAAAAGTGGAGGGANGGYGVSGSNATANTGGGGGGGGGNTSYAGGNGGSGIVIVRYLKA